MTTDDHLHHDPTTAGLLGQDIASISHNATPRRSSEAEHAANGDAIGEHDGEATSTLTDRQQLKSLFRKPSHERYEPVLTREHDLPYKTILRNAALRYAEQGLYVFPCRPMDIFNENGEIKYKAKWPLTQNGHKDASNDPARVTDWWSAFPNSGYPDALIGVRTGLLGGFWVLDIDATKVRKDGSLAADGFASLKQLESKYGPLPDTHMVRTQSGGVHYYFKMPDGVDIRNSASKVGPGIDVRGEGGYVIFPPSMMASGHAYELLSDTNPHDAAWAPDWLIKLATSNGRQKTLQKIESRGWAYRLLARKCEEVAAAADGTRNATLNKAAFVVGRLVVQEQLSREVAYDALLEAAKKLVETDGLPSVKATINSGLNGAGKHEILEPPFPDWTKLGPRRDSIDNVRALLSHLSIKLRYNEFANQAELTGFKKYALLSDNAVDELWGMCHEFRFQPSQEYLRASLRTIALEGSFHPVRDFFDGLRWDGVKRLDTWLSTYLGAEDTRYIRHVGAKMLIAAARRIYQPGAKFDQMVIFEGEQGTGKSTTLRILALRDEWFTDNFALTDDSRKVLEQTEGKLIIEAAEMTGIRKADIEHVKALLSRTHDRARKAYGHFVTEVPRQFIFVGTTNGGAESPYLVDPSGHRRSWPVKTGKIDLASLRRDVDMLWAEAVQRHRDGESIFLPPDLWDDARQEQEKRALEDPWVLALEDGLGDMLGKVRAEDVWTYMGEAVVMRRGQWANENLGKAMRKLGWKRDKLAFYGKRKWQYARGAEPYPQIVLNTSPGERPVFYYAKQVPDQGGEI